MMIQTNIVIRYISLRRRMMNEPYKYTEHQVFHTVWRLLHVDPEIQKAFVAWFCDGVEPKLSYEGISFSEVRKYKKINEFNAFLFMDELKNNPDVALSMLGSNVVSRRTLKVEELRPDLRAKVEEKLKEQAVKEAKQREVMQLNDKGEVTFKIK